MIPKATVELDAFGNLRVRHTSLLSKVKDGIHSAIDSCALGNTAGMHLAGDLGAGLNAGMSAGMDSDSIDIMHMDTATATQLELNNLNRDNFNEGIDCVAKHVESLHFDTALKLKQERVVKKRLAKQMRGYVCADTSLKTTPPISSGTWTHIGKRYSYHDLFAQQQVQIKVLDDFVTPFECEELQKRAQGRMATAAIVGDNGKATVTTARKAKAASVDPIRNPQTPNDPIARLQDRIYAFTNSMTGYGLSTKGQEGFSVIKYLANNGDEYTEHCDGACDGTAVKKGGRVATMVLYCEAAEQGGATTFMNADVLVVPKKGQAAFWSYKGEEGVMDEGMLSEHSGCPVLEGGKVDCYNVDEGWSG